MKLVVFWITRVVLFQPALYASFLLTSMSRSFTNILKNQVYLKNCQKKRKYDYNLLFYIIDFYNEIKNIQNRRKSFFVIINLIMKNNVFEKTVIILFSCNSIHSSVFRGVFSIFCTW